MKILIRKCRHSGGDLVPALLFIIGLLVGMGYERPSRAEENDSPAPTGGKSTTLSATFRPKALGVTVPLLTKGSQLPTHSGRLVAIRGVVSNSKRARILGVRISPGDLRGQESYAVGILMKHTVTQEQIDMSESPWGRPGTTYTLYFDLTGNVAKARKWPNESELKAN